MVKNTDITLYNKVSGPDGPTYHRAYLYGVMWQDVHGVSPESEGLVVSDHTDIFIPFTVTSQKNYALPKIFDAVSDKKNIFTLKPGDLIVKGIINFELTGEKGKNEKALLNTHDNVRVVKEVDTCDYGSGDMRHWEVVAV